MTMNPDGRNEKVLVTGERQVFDYEWSPDGKWICYRAAGRLVRQRAVHHPGDRRDGAGPGPQHHALRHLQQRRHLEPRRAIGSPSSASAGATRPAPTSWRCRQPAAAGRRSGRRRSTGTTSICASSSRPRWPCQRVRHLPRRLQDRLPRQDRRQRDLWVASTDGGTVTAADHGQPRADADPLVALLPRPASTSATAAATSARS